MSPQVKDRGRQSGTAVGLLVFLSATNSFCPRLRPFAACAHTFALYSKFSAAGKGGWGM